MLQHLCYEKLKKGYTIRTPSGDQGRNDIFDGPLEIYVNIYV